MYNLYQFEQDAQKEEGRMNNSQSMKILRRHRVKERDKMVESYKKRVTDFVSMMEKVPINQPDAYLTKLREDEANRNKNKFIGNESMLYSLRSEKERIEENDRKNNLDTDPPEENPLKLRPQDRSKEIVPPLRYSLRGNVEDIYDKLTHKRYKNVQKVDRKKFDEKMSKFKKKFRSRITENSKNTKPFLRQKEKAEATQKTHFKAAYTIYLNYNSCLQDEAAKEMRRDEDEREEMLYPRLAPHRSHAVFSPQTRLQPNERYASVDKPRNAKKGYNDKLQRTYEDFELETDDSVIEIQKAPMTQRDHIGNVGYKGHGKFVKSLSPNGRVSDIFERESQTRFNDDFHQTKGTFRNSQNNQNMASYSQMTQFKTLKNKAQSALEKSNFLRRKHFKGDTLHKGEGKLFMTKGLTNSMYNSAVVKPRGFTQS